MSIQRPSIGRIVLYMRPSGGPVFAAIVVGCRDYVCDIYILPNAPGMDAIVLQCVSHGNGAGYWNWPVKIEEIPSPDLMPEPEPEPELSLEKDRQRIKKRKHR